MVKINVNIQKKDLWLLSAIAVFLVGVSFVIAYNAGYPEAVPGSIASIHGHTGDEIDGNLSGSVGGGMEFYDSGWFNCGLSSSYNKTHNLGTNNLITTLLFSTVSSGASAINVDFSNYGDAVYRRGSIVQGITNTQLTVRTGSNAVAVGLSGGSEVTYSSGYCKVLAAKTGGASSLDLDTCAWTGWSTCGAASAGVDLICPVDNVMRGFNSIGCTAAGCDDVTRCEKYKIYCCG